MRHYEPSKPRVALALIAVAMTTITMGALVVLPARIESLTTSPQTFMASVVVAAGELA